VLQSIVVETTIDHLYRKYLWWAEPSDPPPLERLLAQLMQLGTYEDVRWARREFGDAAFRDALHRAPAGVIDARSWNFWHRVFGIDPIPPLPIRPTPWIPSSQG